MSDNPTSPYAVTVYPYAVTVYPYAVTVYVEGGDHDGETFALGPFASFDDAENARADVMGLGSTDTLPILTVDELLELRL